MKRFTTPIQEMSEGELEFERDEIPHVIHQIEQLLKKAEKGIVAGIKNIGCEDNEQNRKKHYYKILDFIEENRDLINTLTKRKENIEKTLGTTRSNILGNLVLPDLSRLLNQLLGGAQKDDQEEMRRILDEERKRSDDYVRIIKTYNNKEGGGNQGLQDSTQGDKIRSEILHVQEEEVTMLDDIPLLTSGKIERSIVQREELPYGLEVTTESEVRNQHMLDVTGEVLSTVAGIFGGVPGIVAGGALKFFLKAKETETDFLTREQSELMAKKMLTRLFNISQDFDEMKEELEYQSFRIQKGGDEAEAWRLDTQQMQMAISELQNRIYEQVNFTSRLEYRGEKISKKIDMISERGDKVSGEMTVKIHRLEGDIDAISENIERIFSTVGASAESMEALKDQVTEVVKETRQGIAQIRKDVLSDVRDLMKKYLSQSNGPMSQSLSIDTDSQSAKESYSMRIDRDTNGVVCEEEATTKIERIANDNIVYRIQRARTS